MSTISFVHLKILPSPTNNWGWDYCREGKLGHFSHLLVEDSALSSTNKWLKLRAQQVPILFMVHADSREQGSAFGVSYCRPRLPPIWPSALSMPDTTILSLEFVSWV